MHILQLCPRVPFPPHDGGAIAMYDVAAGLARAGHQVTVLAANTPKHQQSAEVLSHLPRVRLLTVPVDTRLNPVKALKNLFLGNLPYNVERFVSQQMVAELTQLLRTERFDVVQVEGTFVAWYVDVIRAEAPTCRWCYALIMWSIPSGRCWLSGSAILLKPCICTIWPMG
ncbi:glycosyltransferase [Hymenobacter qilianensis]|uniref:Glycosyltransferase n=1 Tax=Hymenobacter qilianensis TaxID=1385715 RepID=A0A7H0GUD6_9BACT|nr:glycosyltransferase [Hymenobacter qilianensis]QNP51902.1 glycosyltransferase [Hymenobacter qilianensis]